jgi:hypothetical protein
VQNSRPYFTVSSETPPTWRAKFPFISPRNSVAQLYPRALCSLFVASYDSQDYVGSILTRLHTGNMLMSGLHFYSWEYEDLLRKFRNVGFVVFTAATEIWRFIICLKFAIISHKSFLHLASLHELLFNREDSGSTFPRNMSKLVQDCVAYPERQCPSKVMDPTSHCKLYCDYYLKF